MSDISLNESDEVTIADAAGTNKLIVNADGSVNTGDRSYLLVKNQQLFGVNVETNIVSSGEQPALLLRNPSGSGKDMFLTKIVYAVLGTATRYRVRIYQKPTVTTAGTSASIFSNTIKTSPTASTATAYTAPTISAKGTRMRTYSVEGTNSGVESLLNGIDLMPGFDLLITGDFDATNKDLSISIEWSEE